MEYFTKIKSIRYEGKDTQNELAFKYYNPEEVIMGKPMKEHLKFAMSYWHTLTYGGNDPFGDASLIREWDTLEPMERAKARVHAGFEFMEKLGIEYFCFHDRDIAPEADSLEEYHRNLDEIVDVIDEEMKRTGIRLYGVRAICSRIRALCMGQRLHRMRMCLPMRRHKQRKP